MLIPTIAVAIMALLQQPAAEPPKPEVAAISARLGTCSADFTVKDAAGMPVYGATVHVRIRYGFMNLKRMDLEVGTNSEGKARVEGLPAKARPLVYDIYKDNAKGTAEQDLTRTCNGIYEVSLR